MSPEMPIRRPKPRGWGSPAPQNAPGVPATDEPSPPSPPRVGKRDTAVAPETSEALDRTVEEAPTRRPESSRPFTLRLRASTEEQLDVLLRSLGPNGVDRTELIHALLEAATEESARRAVQLRRRRLADLL